MKKYGPVMRIALGERETVSSEVLGNECKPDVIKDFYKQPYRIG